MMTGLLSTVGFILTAIIAVVAFASLIVALQYISWFHWRKCKYCNHTMEYRGLKEDDNDGHYLFQCRHCGAWEQIPREEFFRNLDNCDPNEQ